MKNGNPNSGFMLFGIIGLGLIIGGIIWYNSMQSFMEAAVETRAIVVDEVRETDPSDRSEYRYLYTLEYSVDGEKFTTTHAVGESPTMEVGQAEKLYYNPDNPADFQLGGSGSATVMIVIGAFCLFIGVVGLMPRRKPAALQETENPQT
jgi:hypothetical protein